MKLPYKTRFIKFLAKLLRVEIYFKRPELFIPMPEPIIIDQTRLTHLKVDRQFNFEEFRHTYIQDLPDYAISQFSKELSKSLMELVSKNPKLIRKYKDMHYAGYGGDTEVWQLDIWVNERK